MLRNYPLAREISVSSFCHCDIGGVTKCACVLVHNLPSSGSVQDELIGKVRRNLDSILMVNQRCLEGCDPPRQGSAAVCGVREIVVYPPPSKLQDSFRVPCVFRSMVWSIRNITVKELESTTDLTQENISEVLALDSVSYGDVMSRLLLLPPVKELQFSL